MNEKKMIVPRKFYHFALGDKVSSLKYPNSRFRVVARFVEAKTRKYELRCLDTPGEKLILAFETDLASLYETKETGSGITST